MDFLAFFWFLIIDQKVSNSAGILLEDKSQVQTTIFEKVYDQALISYRFCLATYVQELSSWLWNFFQNLKKTEKAKKDHFKGRIRTFLWSEKMFSVKNYSTICNLLLNCFKELKARRPSFNLQKINFLNNGISTVDFKHMGDS